jgi:hypothetical protein
MVRRAPYSPVIEIDDDSHSKFIADSSRAKSQMEGEGEDNETKRENFRHGELLFLTVYALIKKENQIFLIYKEILNGAVAVTMASSYMVKYLQIFSYITMPFLIYDVATAPLGKFI